MSAVITCSIAIPVFAEEVDTGKDLDKEQVIECRNFLVQIAEGLYGKNCNEAKVINNGFNSVGVLSEVIVDELISSDRYDTSLEIAKYIDKNCYDVNNPSYKKLIILSNLSKIYIRYYILEPNI